MRLSRDTHNHFVYLCRVRSFHSTSASRCRTISTRKNSGRRPHKAICAVERERRLLVQLPDGVIQEESNWDPSNAAGFPESLSLLREFFAVAIAKGRLFSGMCC